MNKYVLVTKDKIIIRNNKQLINKFKLKEIANGNRNFTEYQFSDIEFMTIFKSDEQEIIKHIKKIVNKED